jgi:small-conductance mechanosensitive channel/osmotically-inducible protein OsmY
MNGVRLKVIAVAESGVLYRLVLLLAMAPAIAAARGQAPIADELARQLPAPSKPENAGQTSSNERGTSTEAAQAVPALESAEASVAQTTGPIDVDQRVDEAKVERFLESTLAKYPGVHEIHAEVEGNVVTLTGVAENDAVRGRLREVALKVEGVVFVVNRVKTTSQVLSAEQRVMRRLEAMGRWFADNWLLSLLAIVVLSGSILAARLFARHGDVLLRPLAGNALLRSVLGSLISGAILLGGLYISLQIFGVAQAVLSVVGLAGVVALALGFAFRDIAENFIASVLLGVRPPFRLGDYVKLAGHEGIVKSLNTRATVLTTLDGHRVRIPNAVVFKSILVNTTASDVVRATIDLTIPYEVSVARALDVINRALRDFDGLADQPPARALVEGLESGCIRIRVFYWAKSRGVDGFKLQSDVRLAVKAALEKAGIVPGSSPAAVSVVGLAPVRLRREPHTSEHDARQPHATTTPERRIRADRLRDQRAAADAADRPAPPADTALEMLTRDEEEGLEEGENLLRDHKHQQAAMAADAGEPR